MTIAQQMPQPDRQLPDIQAAARGLCEGGQHHGIAEFMEAKYIATSF
jgi:hypothetical protein